MTTTPTPGIEQVQGLLGKGEIPELKNDCEYISRLFSKSAVSATKPLNNKNAKKRARLDEMFDEYDKVGAGTDHDEGAVS